MLTGYTKGEMGRRSRQASERAHLLSMLPSVPGGVTYIPPFYGDPGFMRPVMRPAEEVESLRRQAAEAAHRA